MQRPSRRVFLGSSAVVLTGLSGCLSRLTDRTGGETGGNDHDENETESQEDDGDDTTAGEEDTADNESPDPPEGGAVVFVYDDGPIEDYTQAFPAHQAFDAPATTGIVTEWIGRENYMGTDWMDIEHLEELEDAGWEIASHTTEHTVVGTFALLEDAEPSDDRVYPEEINHGYWRSNDIEITDGENTVTRTVLGYDEDDTGQYLELDGPLGESFTNGETVTRFGEEAMHEALGESKRELEALGFEIDTFLAPYDNFDDYSREFAPEYYMGIANAEHGSRINDPEEFDPFYTERDYFIEFTSSDAVRADLDEIADRGALGVIGAHTFKDEVTEEGIYETLEWVDERDIAVMTLREAIERYAVNNGSLHER
jgi:hypothetical protein